MNKGFWIVIVLISCVVVGLLLYTGPEEKAKKAYEQALAVEQEAKVEQALTLYDKIIIEFPETESAALAEKGRLRIMQKKQEGLKKEMQDQVGRILLVLNGYRSMLGNMPASLSDLDNSEYFFDSDYLAEVVPAGYTTYLFLAADEAPRIWPVRADKDDVYVSIDSQGSLQKMSRAEALQEIESGYAEVATKGEMVFLQKK